MDARREFRSTRELLNRAYSRLDQEQGSGGWSGPLRPGDMERARAGASPITGTPASAAVQQPFGSTSGLSLSLNRPGHPNTSRLTRSQPVTGSCTTSTFVPRGTRPHVQNTSIQRNRPPLRTSIHVPDDRNQGLSLPRIHSGSSQSIPSFERKYLFQPYRRRQGGSKKKLRISVWRHQFVCLAKTGQVSPPTAFEKAELLAAGLGEKTVSVPEYGESWELHEELLYTFPKLKDGGGYELLRSLEANTRVLRVIPCPPGGYTAIFLKSVVSQAKLYIRPIQCHLNLSVVDSPDGEGMVRDA